MGTVLSTVEELDPGDDGFDTLLILPHRLAKGDNVAIIEKGGSFWLQRSRKPLSMFTDMSSMMGAKINKVGLGDETVISDQPMRRAGVTYGTTI